VSSGNFGAFDVTESGGVWKAAQEIPGVVPAKSSQHFSFGVSGISCPAVGDCAAVLNNGATSTTVPYVANETSGTWAAALPVAGVVGSADVNVVSCAAPGACLAAGEDSWGPSADGFNTVSDNWVAEESSSAVTQTSAALSTTKVIYGHEQTEKVTATVRATTPAPAGTVTIEAGSTKLCTIKLASGTGSCTLPVASLTRGTFALTAHYNGGSGFAASVSSAKTLTVGKANTSMIFKLAASQATYGHEQLEKLKVQVPPQYAGRPSGTVTVLWRGVTICVITLNRDTGACAMTAKQLKPGTYTLVAKYHGDGNFNGSSADQILTVVG
jgi:hypothetical protein